MWFKQLNLFKLTSITSFSANTLIEKLEPLTFTPCLPSMPTSMGWVSPIDEENMPLVRRMNGCFMICLQIEDKILPASVVNQALKEKVKHIEATDGKKLRQKEKLSFKDEVIFTLLPRAFSKLTRLYAYIDTKNKWLIVNTLSPKKVELMLNMLKKSLGDCFHAFEVTKPSVILTEWLKQNNCPKSFAIEKACILQDPDEQKRMIRCQQQDLFTDSIQSLIKTGCNVIQMALCWQDRIQFVLAEDFTLRSIHRAKDDLAELEDQVENKAQKFDTDFFMMTEMFRGVLQDLLAVFMLKSKLALTA